VCASALQDIKSHSARSTGLQTSCVSSGLAPALVDHSMSQADVKAAVNEVVGYDGRVVPNPSVTTAPTEPCHIKSWGLCSKEMLLEAASIATYNLYVMLKKNKFDRDKFPISLQMQVGEYAERFLIVDTLGRGEAVFLVALSKFGDLWTLQLVDGLARALAHACSLSIAVRKFILRSAEKTKINASKFKSIHCFVNEVEPMGLNGGLGIKNTIPGPRLARALEAFATALVH